MKSRILAICLFAPFACLLLWTCVLTWQRHHGLEVKVAVTGYDPSDLLSGHYIQYQVDWEHTDCTQFPKKECPKNDFGYKERWGLQCRFYVPEKYAEQLDELFRHRNNNDLTFEVVYSYIPGREAIATQLLINGESWEKHIHD